MSLNVPEIWGGEGGGGLFSVSWITTKQPLFSLCDSKLETLLNYCSQFSRFTQLKLHLTTLLENTSHCIARHWISAVADIKREAKNTATTSFSFSICPVCKLGGRTLSLLIPRQAKLRGRQRDAVSGIKIHKILWHLRETTTHFYYY